MPETIKDQINNVTEKNEAADFETKVDITTKNLEIEAQKINLAAYETDSKSEQDSPDENDMLIVTDYDDTVWVGTAYEIFIEMKTLAEAWRRRSISDEEYFNSKCEWVSRMSGEKMDAKDLSKDLSMAKKTRILYDRIQKAELMDIEVCDPKDIEIELI